MHLAQAGVGSYRSPGNLEESRSGTMSTYNVLLGLQRLLCLQEGFGSPTTRNRIVISNPNLDFVTALTSRHLCINLRELHANSAVRNVGCVGVIVILNFLPKSTCRKMQQRHFKAL